MLKHNMDEFTYEKICRTVLGFLNPDVNYCVNLAGGTRYMALAVQQMFERFKSEFFYVQVEENLIVKSAFDELHKALTDICVNSKDGITSIYP